MENDQGTLSWSPADVISFPAGIPGFEGAREFVIFTRAEHEPFHWMRSVNGPAAQFVLINPLLLRADYDPVVSSTEIRELDVRDPKELLLYTIVTVHDDMSASTVNFLGPLFINIRTRIGKQILVDDPRWSTSERILP